jgi:transcriptional regulator with XRE-family HTH domain
MTLGEKIKIARLKVDLSQHQLGDIANTHQKNISKYEKDLVIPSAVTLKKIADALNVTTDYLLGDDFSNSIKDTALLKQFKEIDKMKDEDKNALMMVINAFIRDNKARQAYAA